MNRMMIALWSLLISFSMAGCVLEGDELVEVADDSIAAESFDDLMTLQVEQEQPAEAKLDEDHGTEGCWVVLEWCENPLTGGPTCSASGTTCTRHQIDYHCGVLIAQYC